MSCKDSDLVFDNNGEGVEIPSEVSKSNRTLNLLYARAVLEKIGTNE